ncbi:membrane-bound lytic murein transglycosylase D [Nitrosomonas sp. PY1]|uniref:transglycosylase SLT domain-containing protein n=1 Tax=Nitrosomonas sp. PY1 TaxID=1803906 RepID=UPI001FC84A9C|nr:transglycosylase SLT domain-containing protein [Nitrosomonas sp. PY1]GKS70155.1 membrane-bound lytic murein transglycosylase D [Nitrosomonas sp. PY1]
MILKRKTEFLGIAASFFWICLLVPFNISANQFLQDNNSQTNLWDRVRNGFTLAAPPDSKERRTIQASYAKNLRMFNRIVSNSERYLFHIVEEVERRGMPLEIALIPVVESSYNPLVKATPGNPSTGLWQFVPRTGRYLGLSQTMWYDDRRDVIASTEAALNYLQYLYDRFDSWELAIASYNIGEGVVGRILAKTSIKDKAKGFYQLNLPIEAKQYVYKLLVVKDIIANSKKYGIKLRSVPNQPYFDTVKIHKPIEVPVVARLANISETEFIKLNPAYNGFVVKVFNEPRTLLLPRDNSKTFLRNLQIYQNAKVPWQLFHVKKGENIQLIANRHGTTVHLLRAMNNLFDNKQIALANDQLLLIPSSSKQSDASVSYKKASADIYIVKKGDTLYHIAKRYGTTIDQIKQWNNNSDISLSIGQELLLAKN